MIIKLRPQRTDASLVVSKAGDTLVVNGATFDFSPLGDDMRLPRHAIDSDCFADDVYRVGGELIVTLLLPVGRNPSPSVAFPEDLVGVPDGDVAIPFDPEPEPDPDPEPEPEEEPS